MPANGMKGLAADGQSRTVRNITDTETDLDVLSDVACGANVVSSGR